MLQKQIVVKLILITLICYLFIINVFFQNDQYNTKIKSLTNEKNLFTIFTTGNQSQINNPVASKSEIEKNSKRNTSLIKENVFNQTVSMFFIIKKLIFLNYDRLVFFIVKPLFREHRYIFHRRPRLKKRT